ncbi:MAG TPA: GGDEF domain-containing protein [Gemmatimonadaceae bacterium]|nr:GGDEF domain-containing protein [Gemmatimonadaceae bacterium]
MLTQKLRALVLPEGVLLVVAVALVHWGAAVPSALPFLRAAPLVVLAAGILLALRFGRGRLVVALGALLLADQALVHLLPFDPHAVYPAPAVVGMVAILLPTTLAVLAFLDERSVLRGAGLRRLAWLAVPTVLVLAAWVVADTYPEQAARVVGFALIPLPLLLPLPLGQPATLGALVAIAVLLIRALWRPDFESRGFLWAAVASLIAVSVVDAGGQVRLYLAAGGLVLVVATVEATYAMAFRDELTGLPARRALDEALKQVEGTYAVAMVDVDHFKQFNDTYGHDAGDQVLRLVATCLRRVGGGGRAFRYGGEEFVVLFPRRSVEESAPHLEKLREAVAESAFVLRGPRRPRRKPKHGRKRPAKAERVVVTVSIGAAQSRASLPPAEVVKAADRALYKAKDAGRNRLEW